MQVGETVVAKQILTTSWMPNGKEKLAEVLNEEQQDIIDAINKFLI